CFGRPATPVAPPGWQGAASRDAGPCECGWDVRRSSCADREESPRYPALRTPRHVADCIQPLGGNQMANRKSDGFGLTRRTVLRTGAGAAGATLIPGFFGPLGWAYAADDKPAIGTWPAGSEGDTVHIGAAVPLTGTYAAQGADELKGWELAVEHMNTNHELMKAIAPKVDNGVLGKKVALLSADSAAKPNNAVQIHQTFINENKIILMTGSTSSAVAVATN